MGEEKRFNLYIDLIPGISDYLQKKTLKNKLQQSLLQIGRIADVQVIDAAFNNNYFLSSIQEQNQFAIVRDLLV